MNELFTQLLMQVSAENVGGLFKLESYDSDDSGPIYWLLGPAAGVAFYTTMYLRYRNTNKRHAYEHHTASEMTDVRASDEKVGTVKGSESSQLPAANSENPLMRLGQATTVVEAYKRVAETPGADPSASDSLGGAAPGGVAPGGTTPGGNAPEGG